MTPPRQLRSIFVRSHLLVMVVAVGTLVVGVVLIGGVLVALDVLDLGRGGKGGEPDGGPLPLLAIVGSAVVAASFVSRRLARRLAEPLETLGVATRRLAGGDYTVRVQDDSSAETAQLAADVNELAETLDATEKRRLELIGEVAHELRTPLTSIEGSMEALLDGVLEPSDEVFAGIAREAARLRRVAGDLSELSRTSDGLRLVLGRTDLADVVGGVVDRLAVQAEAKGLALSFSTALDDPIIDGDHDRLVQVATNVIGNAIRYTDAGSIGVTLGPGDGASVEVEVVDTGRGIDPTRTEEIFDRFVRADPTQSDGTGVGLTIARALVTAHGGTITADSAGEGTGTTVRVRLPRRGPGAGSSSLV